MYTNNVRVFEYTRGDQFGCKIIINEFAGSLVFSDIKVPNNTPQAVKQAFLEEAEVAVLKKVEESEAVLHRGG